MQIAVSEAKGQLLELVRRAEGGEDIVLARHGRPIARLVGLASDAAVIVIDTSALMAVLLDEPEAARCSSLGATSCRLIWSPPDRPSVLR